MTKKKIAPKADHFACYEEQMSNCCGLLEVGGFDEIAVNSYDDIFWDSDDAEFDINWNRIPPAVIKELRKKFVCFNSACVATTIIEYQGGKAPNLKDGQGIANKVLRATGWKIKAEFMGNEGKLLRLWFFPKGGKEYTKRKKK